MQMDKDKIKELFGKSRWVKGKPLSKQEMIDIVKGAKLLKSLEATKNSKEHFNGHVSEVLKGLGL